MPLSDQFRALRHTTLTATIDRIEEPYSFWNRLLFSGEEILDKDTFEIGSVARDRQAAPFVRHGASAQLIRPDTSKIAHVSVPHIRLKDPYNPGDNYFVRQVGERLYDQRLTSRMQREVAKSLRYMKMDIAMTREWMGSQVVQGSLAYDVAGGDSFELTHPDKPATVSASTAWNAVSGVDIISDIRTAKRLMAQVPGGGFQCTHGVMDQTAADALLSDSTVQQYLRTDHNPGYQVGGPLSPGNPFVEFGAANYLGSLLGVQLWEYTASITVGGTPYPMVRAGYCEFLSVTPKLESKTLYAPILDPRLLASGSPATRFFSKSWFDEDPGSFYILATSRPMPFIRRIEGTLSMNVI